MRAAVAAGVTGSLMAALALSYVVLPGSVVPQTRFGDPGAAAGTTDAPAGVVVVPAAEATQPLRQPAGAVSAVLAPGGGEKRALARAEARARSELAPRLKQDRKRAKKSLDTVSAAYLPAAVSLVRSSGPREPQSRTARATVAGTTVDVAVGTTTERDDRARTVAVVESPGREGAPALRSVESLEGVPCPDGDGVLDFRVSVEVGVEATRGTATRSLTEAHVRAQVDDAGGLHSATADLATRQDGVDAAGTVAFDDGSALGEVVAVGDLPADSAPRRTAERGLAAARALAAGALAAAEELWAGGGCLAVRADLPDVVAEGSEIELDPVVVSLVDGEEVDAPVEVAVDGPGRVEEIGAGAFVFTAGSERGSVSAIVVTSTSARGVVEHRFEIATPSPDLRVAATFKNVRVRGTKCAGPIGRWQWDILSGGGSAVGSLAFRLSSDLDGTYAGQRTFSSSAGSITVTEAGSVRYLPGRGALVLADREGGRWDLPVERGAFC